MEFRFILSVDGTAATNTLRDPRDGVDQERRRYKGARRRHSFAPVPIGRHIRYIPAGSVAAVFRADVRLVLQADSTNGRPCDVEPRFS